MSQIQVVYHLTDGISNSLFLVIASVVICLPDISISFLVVVRHCLKQFLTIFLLDKSFQLIIHNRRFRLDLMSHLMSEDKLNTFKDGGIKGEIYGLGIRVEPSIANHISSLPLDCRSHHPCYLLNRLAQFLPDNIINESCILYTIILYIRSLLFICHIVPDLQRVFRLILCREWSIFIR